MTLTRSEVITYWIEPALTRLRSYPAFSGFDLSSTGVRDLLACVGKVESDYQALRQRGNGPAMGFWQMEPATLTDHLRWLAAKGVHDFADTTPAMLATDPVRAVIFARIQFMRRPGNIPQPSLGTAYPAALAAIHKDAYNTALGKADLNLNTHIMGAFLHT